MDCQSITAAYIFKSNFKTLKNLRLSQAATPKEQLNEVMTESVLHLLKDRIGLLVMAKLEEVVM